MLTDNESKFVRNNKEYWKAHEKEIDNNSIILVEGQLMGAPNYLIRSAMAAKAVQEAVGGKIVVVIDASKEAERNIKALCRSYGIRRSINLKEIKIPFKVRAQAIGRCIRIFFKRKPDEILKLSYKGINMGHLVYDDILHDDIKSDTKNKHYTINRLDMYCIRHVYDFFVKSYIYEKLLFENEVTAYISTHTVYIEYGILPFLAVERHIPVVYSDDFAYAVIEDNEDLYVQDRIRKHLIDVIKSNRKDVLIDRAEKSFRCRMSGQGNVDIKLAYSNNKKSYLRKELMEKLGINNHNPVVFIFAHVFRDSPHTSSQMLYRDHYEWLEDTLLHADKIHNINWVLKEHPSGEKIYKEKGIVLDILKKNKLTNILVCPSDFNTNSIANVADGVLTCQGTIGIECSCMGVPAVVCGKAFYTGFGFTIEPQSINQYRKVLMKLKHIKKLSVAKIEKAKIVYAAYQIYCGKNLALLDNDVLDCIWGYEREQNIEEAYRLINERFGSIDFVNTPLYQDVYQYFKNSKGICRD